ncbi:MAG: hypothetical protein HOE90_03620 [Bacteriovoracaceae bacterium]|jgi:hypothetical protein|nr:hypothetical protein [Bacteriovoracaceae bacterium]
MQDSWTENFEKAWQRIECGDLSTRLECLEQIFQTTLLLKSCGEKQNCFGCMEKYFLSGYQAFSSIIKQRQFEIEVRQLARTLLSKVFEELKIFYTLNKMDYQQALLNSRFKKDHFYLFCL